jgi:dipeptidyl aminopeptidase/acylaminoacyl peptidase
MRGIPVSERILPQASEESAVMTHILSLVALAWPLFAQVPDNGGALQTVSERSGYRATARYDDVVAWCREFAKAAPGAHLTELGRSSEGRSIPLLILADPPLTTAQAATRSGKLICLIIGNIHAGEVCGKEALPILLREEFSSPHPPLLKDLILAVAPIYNPDGNERVSKTNRPGQAGPEEGVGQRTTARGLDLNRDFIKLEAPETRGLVHFLNEWNPHLFIDTHTTNGSYHRYTITYDGPKNPAGDAKIVSFMRQTLFPELSAAFKKQTGLESFFYGNFDHEHTRWTTYPAEPRYGTTYVGLRNRLAVLSEAYAYAPYKTRVLATRDFVRNCLQVAANHKTEIAGLLSTAEQATRRGGRLRQETDLVPVRSRVKATERPTTILGYLERQENGRRIKTDTSKDYTVQLRNEFEAAETVAKPFAYLIPSTFSAAVATLKRHGLQVQELREDIELDLEVYRIERIERSTRSFEGHHTETLNVTPRAEARRVPAGTLMVETAQPLGSLAVGLLEPRSEDGLATWNFFDPDLKEDADFPVWRLPKPASFATTASEELAETQEPPRPITFDTMGGGGRRRGRGGFMGFFALPQWLDGAHFLQVRAGQLHKVDAATGRSKPFVDAAALEKGLTKLSSLDQDTARSIARRPFFDMSPNKQGFLFEHNQDLYYATFDGSTAVRLTNDPGHEQWPHFSPDSKSVAFVRGYDLFTVDIPGQKEHRLTTGGTSELRHGHADWVYFEEIFNRRWPAFWWSPDSRQLAFLEFDNSAVPVHTVLDDSISPRNVERTHYPRSGEPNPKVRLGIIASTGGSISWADLADYSPDSFLLSEVGWWPDSSAAYCYVQNRVQTWLDVVKIAAGANGGSTRRLFRDATKAWVESPGPLHVLDDKTFLWLSERDGWRHLYHYDASGSLKAQLTSGPWEIRRIEHVDPKSGWITFSATRDNPVAANYYSLKPGGPIERLTQRPGSHTVSVSPDGQLYLSSWSDLQTPAQVKLHGADGRLIRTIDSNPSYELKHLQFGPHERFKIPTSDGFQLEAELILPPNLEPERKYPVWFTTYGGPHAPTVSDAWGGGHMWDHALAHEGFIVFHMDPRSASGKGAASSWTAYKHLGVQELDDIKTAINWLKKKPYVDGARIGMSGHSYGGYITSYAMTHCDLFAAGIAGAPVTDWRDYDSIYTERYMGLPQENPEGYKLSSVVNAAGNLHGKLLILHGAIDDNVSLRNTMRLVEALQHANKDFELMIYPSSRHGIFGQHYNKLQLDFIRRTLGGRTAAPAKPASSSEVATSAGAGSAGRGSREGRRPLSAR